MTEVISMSKVADFYSKLEKDKPADRRVYHNNGACPPGRDVKANGDDLPGTGGYRLCNDCSELNRQGR